MERIMMTIGCLILSAQSALAAQIGWYKASGSQGLSALISERGNRGWVIQTIEFHNDLSPQNLRSAQYLLQPFDGGSSSAEEGTLLGLRHGPEGIRPVRYRVPFLKLNQGQRESIIVTLSSGEQIVFNPAPADSAVVSQ